MPDHCRKQQKLRDSLPGLFGAALVAAVFGWTTVSAQTAPSTRAKATRPLASASELKSRADTLRTAYLKPPTQWPAPTLDPGVELRELGKLPPVQHPPDNPYSEPKAELGKMLFFDARLSDNASMSCASCHVPELAFTDGRTTAFGHRAKETARNTPTLKHVGHAKVLMWDGSASSLEQQALMPVANPREMHSDAEAASARIAAVAGYGRLFQAVFGTPEVNSQRIAQAIACFERTLEWKRSDFDRFLDGESAALSDSAIRGLDLFRTTARCLNCHNGPELSDQSFHNLGLTYYGRELQDLGRYEVTHNPTDVGKFKTPTLRDVTRSTPFMHNGLFDLEGVINMYDAGMATVHPKPDQVNDPLFPKKDALLKPLHLNRQDKEDLKAFLQSLEDPRQRMRSPALPE